AGVTSRVDLLLTIDNSRSMADKQAILGSAVPALIGSLTNPPCVDEEGMPAQDQPTGPSSACPSDTTRIFPPVTDLHLGVISTSIGDHGGDVCPTLPPPSANDDQARLIARSPGGGSVATYDDLGFLAWDPDGELTPPGETSAQALTDDLRTMVLGAGQQGCGYEAPLESWYRFLIDPDPYLTIEEDAGRAVMSGTDSTILQQRRDFLRPDSLVIIMMLSDENDCSIRDGSQYFYAAKSQTSAGQYHLPRAQITCESDPNDPCCRSCGQTDDGCPPKGAECDGSHDVLSDSFNLRCYDQKRRFGIDFLQPIDRYVDGLTSHTVADREGNVVGNPLFSDLDPNDDISSVRSPQFVILASIQGVPWQDIARRTSEGEPDLRQGRDAQGRRVGGFQSAAELSANDTWDLILGDPTYYHTQSSARPQDPLMRESVDPRSGTNPITGDSLAPPGAATMANPINGHEYTIDQRNDLQYACIFELPQPRDCTAPGVVACDCPDAVNDNPLCQNDQNQFGTTQYRAKAYPGIRQLELLKQLGARAALGSICPAQLDDASRPDFGYVPSIRALVEAIRPRLATE
ncbi:MAG: hypothetical protein JRI23_00950, partial [Deltaproteobacteria bacterium]|nr:hypothetical protein [Deltaproteobacteria bacterium]MBW2530021.1 hypothetical protein [Deltaproteobacteria bacterium]